MKRLLALAVIPIAAAWFASCRDSTSPMPDAAVARAAVVVSAPTPLVYLALSPGGVADGSNVTVGDARTSATASVTMAQGGFDPIPVAATAGDTLHVSIRRMDGQTLQFTVVVPSKRPPVVVRTDPPPQKPDVPLNAHIVVVFSEPIDSTTLTVDNLHLLQGATIIGGRVGFTDSTHVTAEFVPDGPLAPGAPYELVITQGIRDLDGEPLESQTTVGFTTMSTAAALMFSVEPSFTATGIPIVPAVQVAAVDAHGMVVPTFTGTIHVGPAPGDSALTGTTAVVAVGGVAVFSDLTFRFSGTAHRLVAWAVGLRPDTSGIFGVAPASSGTPPGRVAFINEAGPTSSSLLVMNGDGSAVTTIFTGGPLGRATWSPDGTRLAFSGLLATSCGMVYLSTYACQSKIYIASADGSNASGASLLHLTDSLAWDSADPAWSPDGTRIAFTYLFDQVDGPSNIYVMNVDGSGKTRITDAAPGGQEFFYPAWAPTGASLVFQNWVYGSDGSEQSSELWMEADGTLQPLLQGVKAHEPAWSPDGTKVVFVAGDRGGISVATANGVTAPLTSDPSDVDAEWTPDGRIVFARNDGPNGYRLHLMNADGSGDVVLPQPSGGNRHPSWMPATALPAARGRVSAGRAGQ